MKIPAVRRLPSGSYFCQLRINGQSISITEPTYDLCYAKAVALKAGLIQAKRAPSTLTLRQACQQYIDDRQGIRDVTTLHTYQSYTDYSLQSIMDRSLNQLTPPLLKQAFREEARRETRKHQPVSAKHVRNVHAFIKSVLKEQGIEMLANIPLPEPRKKPVAIPPAEMLLPALIGTDIELPCLLAAWLSLTMSEIRGLTKSRSIQYGQLVLGETVVRVNRQDVHRAHGKEENRLRMLTIPPYIARLIDAAPGDVLVTLSAKQINDRLKKICQSLGIPPLSFHKLRHLNASVMAMLQIQKEIAMDRGGWKNTSVMDNTYTHVFSPQRQLADQRIDAYFSGIIANENANES